MPSSSSSVPGTPVSADLPPMLRNLNNNEWSIFGQQLANDIEHLGKTRAKTREGGGSLYGKELFERIELRRENGEEFSLGENVCIETVC